MKSIKKVLAVLLSLIMLFAIGTVSYAEDEAPAKSFTIISSNVAGLPIPSVFSEDKRVVPETTKLLGQLLNESGIDIICVQEDFQFHSTLAKEMTNYPYQTFTSGGVPVGDGLNIFSKYPIYNIERVMWEEFNGILDAANDGLTPKGFLKCTADIDGVLVDIYDIHVDANGSYEDCLAKQAQLRQLSAYINENSVGRPVVITGDYNVSMHADIDAQFYPIMIQGEGYEDAWTVFCNDGVYFTERLPQEKINEYDQKWGGYYWGHWDSVERLLLRGVEGVGMSVTGFEYVDYNVLAGQKLTDHNVMVSEVTLDTTGYTRPEIELNAPEKESLGWRIGHAIEMFTRSFILIVTDLISKLVSGEIG